MSVVLALPILLGVTLLVLIALTTVYRPRPHDIDNVILSARKLDISELEVLLDASSEWNLRRSLSQSALQETQEDRKIECALLGSSCGEWLSTPP